MKKIEKLMVFSSEKSYIIHFNNEKYTKNITKSAKLQKNRYRIRISILVKKEMLRRKKQKRLTGVEKQRQ